MYTELDGTELAVTPFQAAREHLQEERYHGLITGVAGFIGSNLLETLLGLGQRVSGLDNFITGHRHNLEQVRTIVGAAAWDNFTFIEGDIRDPATCQRACAGVDYVLHHAALGSVARSLDDPLLSHDINISGFVAMLDAARAQSVKRIVYASSSAIYGDHPALPKREDEIGQPLSPYALTKSVNEQYAAVYARCYGLQSIGLRYFNVFGPRQDPAGAYAAVIPCWMAALRQRRAVTIHGDGETSRDFCFVGNAVQANLLAALATDPAAVNQVYNVAVHERTSLNALYRMLDVLLLETFPQLQAARDDSSPESGPSYGPSYGPSHGPSYGPSYGPFRAGDVRHSLADIGKAASLLGFSPTHDIRHGLKLTVAWYQGQT